MDRDREIMELLIEQLKKGKLKDEKKWWEDQLDDREKGNKNKIQNRLLYAVERYLAMVALEKDVALKNTLLAGAYLEMGVLKNATSCINKARSQASKDRDRDLKNALIQFWTLELEVDHSKNNRSPTEKIELMESALQEFYDIQSMRLLCEKANRKKIIHDYDGLRQTL